MNIQQHLSPILNELHDICWEQEAHTPTPNAWTNKDIASVTKLFSKVIFERMYLYQQDNNAIDMDAAERIGKEIYQLVKSSTGVDLHEYYNEISKQ